MEIKKTEIKDLHNSINKDLPSLHKGLEKILGAKNPFAKFHIGNGFYIWTDTNDGWNNMKNASLKEQDSIRETIEELHRSLPQKVGERTAKSLLTFPDESYIHYKDIDGQLKILITGWGFKKPVTKSPKPDNEALKEKQYINLSFSIDGEKQAGYKFRILYDKQERSLVTDSNGLYTIENLKPGKVMVLTDGNDIDHTVTIAKGQNDYDIDVTTLTTIKTKATQDGQPIVGEEVIIEYRGQSFNAQTDSDGETSTKVTVWDNAEVVAKMRNKEVCQTITREDNVLVFEFKTETKEEPQPEEVEDKPENEVNTQKGQSDDIDAPKIPPIPDDITKQGDDVPPYLPFLKIIGDNDYIGSNHPVSIEHQSRVTEHNAYENGILPLSEMKAGDSIVVTDLNDTSHSEEYILNEEQEEYIFYIPAQEEQQIVVMMRDVKGVPIVCEKVGFCQKGKETIFVKLDDNGNAYFKEEELPTNVPIEVTIHGASKNYKPFVFNTEENRYEYLLQEGPSGKSCWSIALLLLIMGILVSILILLWPAFIILAEYVYNMIY
ncbi:MAG: hypothetical protein SOZ80_02385 [Prevotella sp.]|uniref:hypothetical protein n=1 Tax=Prevotella sp. TaxID=59823 RepID=UPI002A27C6B4|nr:hypothetical protein [Prevotella sp.]MDD7319109.1 hypothetical protein [Prevotellaceae bacterium]MDY4019616.1 hypothetical protein [Prevotella sp.]